MKKGLLLVLSALFCAAASGCSDPKGAKEALEKAGYTSVSVGDRDTWASWNHPFLCHKNVTNTKFTAKDSSGQLVSGVVCNQLFGPNIVVEKASRLVP